MLLPVLKWCAGVRLQQDSESWASWSTMRGFFFSTRHVGQIIHYAISLSSKPREFTEAAQLLSQAEFNLLSC